MMFEWQPLISLADANIENNGAPLPSNLAPPAKALPAVFACYDSGLVNIKLPSAIDSPKLDFRHLLKLHVHLGTL
jgi:hypothetical protein